MDPLKGFEPTFMIIPNVYEWVQYYVLFDVLTNLLLSAQLFPACAT